jgi:hypothetical protein
LGGKLSPPIPDKTRSEKRTAESRFVSEGDVPEIEGPSAGLFPTLGSLTGSAFTQRTT